MTTQTGAMSATHFRRGWIYVLTLSLVTINYMDRSALGVVAQAIRGEFKLSPIEMGYLFSSFFWSYALCLLPIGIMLDRYSTRRINSVGIAVWSLAMAAATRKRCAKMSHFSAKYLYLPKLEKAAIWVSRSWFRLRNSPRPRRSLESLKLCVSGSYSLFPALPFVLHYGWNSMGQMKKLTVLNILRLERMYDDRVTY